MNDFSIYLNGERLFGDDFDQSQLEEWFAAEEEGYAELGAADRGSYSYEYHAWNVRHGYAHVPQGRLGKALGFGSAYGDEFFPVIDRIDSLVVVDPSGHFSRDHIRGVQAHYIKPAPNGALDMPSDEFDLITCLGVLHHIPNVSSVVAELCRLLKPGGHMLVREPIVSMGDWRQPRLGLTKNERGIPLPIMRQIFENSGLRIRKMTLAGFPVTEKLFQTIRKDVYNSNFMVCVDEIASRAFQWNINYHAETTFRKLRPTSAYFVLSK